MKNLYQIKHSNAKNMATIIIVRFLLRMILRLDKSSKVMVSTINIKRGNTTKSTVINPAYRACSFLNARLG